MVLLLGDIHGNFNFLKHQIHSKQITDCTIIQVGDFIKLNNEVKMVTNVNYTGNTKILTLANNFTYSNTGNISVNKVFTTKAANVQIIKLTSAGYT